MPNIFNGIRRYVGVFAAWARFPLNGMRDSEKSASKQSVELNVVDASFPVRVCQARAVTIGVAADEQLRLRPVTQSPFPRRCYYTQETGYCQCRY